MFTEKYKPKRVSEIIGQEKAITSFNEWIKKWRKGNKALLLHGPPGSGKTSLIQAYANERNLDFIEMNASDFRTADQIKEVLGQSTRQMSLFGKGKIFLLDEIDGLSGRKDSGGVKEIIDLIKKSNYPIILTANDPWNQKLRTLRTYCQLVEFSKINFYTNTKQEMHSILPKHLKE